MPDRSHSLSGHAGMPRPVPLAELALLPHATKFSFRGRHGAVAAASAAFGVALPMTACQFQMRGDRGAYWLGPDEWLLTAAGDEPDALFATMQTALAGQSFSLVDVSHRSDGFAISGARSAYILNHGCPLDLSATGFPVGMCTRTIIGKAGVLLSRPKDDTFHVDIWRSFAPYVWQLLDEARSELA